MTHASCPDCRLRFPPAVAAYLPACPACGEALQHLARLDQAVGFRLYRLDDVQHSLPEAVEMAMPTSDLDAGRPRPSTTYHRPARTPGA
jgi:hypothetical protein